MARGIANCGIIILMLVVAALADAPTAINYQGRLTNSAGDPVADGKYSLAFTIYDAEAGGDSKWTETQNVNVVDGLFSVLLGTLNPLTETVFGDMNSYMGISVNGGPEGTPRVKLVTVPYAFHSNKADSAGYADNANMLDGLNSSDFLTGAHDHDSVYVNVTGDEMTGPLVFHTSATPMTYMYHGGTTNPARAVVAHSPAFPNWGLMYDDLNDEFVFTGNDDTNLVVQPSGDGDNAVRLGVDAIGADEILDEPGIAQGHSAFTLELDTLMTDVITATITIPNSGFIFLLGHATIYFWLGSFGDTYVQIDETAGGDPIPGVFSYVSSNSYDHIDCTAQRTYFKGAGTYTFRLEAMKVNTSLSNPAAVRAISPTLTAIYLPSSYGEVWSVAADQNGDPQAKRIQITDPVSTELSTAHDVDLRTLEIKARKARKEALRAELELRKAQDQQATNGK